MNVVIDLVIIIIRFKAASCKVVRCNPVLKVGAWAPTGQDWIAPAICKFITNLMCSSFPRP